MIGDDDVVPRRAHRHTRRRRAADDCEVINEKDLCNPDFPDFDPQGMVCENNGRPDEAYCNYSFGPNACVIGCKDDDGGNDVDLKAYSAKVAIEIEVQVDDLPNDIGWTLQCEDEDLVTTTYVDRKPPRKLLETGTCGCEDPGVAFCNYDLGDRGTCERCKDVQDCDKDNWLVLKSPRTRSNPGITRALPLKGAEDCRLWCSKERDASSYWFPNETNSTNNESEQFFEDGDYRKIFGIPEGSNCLLTVFQNHGFGTKCNNYYEGDGGSGDRCYQVYQRRSQFSSLLIAQECGGWNKKFADNIKVPFIEIDFYVSSSPDGRLSCKDFGRGVGGSGGGGKPLIFITLIFILGPLIMYFRYQQTGTCTCFKQGLFGPSAPAFMSPGRPKMQEAPAATGPATNALGATVEERLETLESMKKYGLSQEELEKMKNQILSATNALGATVEERLESLESIKKYLSQEELEKMKNETLSSTNALGATVEDRLETLESIKKYLSQEECEQTKNEILSSK